ncbi:hypothetical protein BLOT_002867 [Blomia tropicalis]|nr:hypothetical protein BLOT_002867 [Blomia tropicalis]
MFQCCERLKQVNRSRRRFPTENMKMRSVPLTTQDRWFGLERQHNRSALFGLFTRYLSNVYASLVIMSAFVKWGRQHFECFDVNE